MIFLAVFEYAILALTFTIAKVAVGYSDPLFLIAIRMLAASPIMIILHFTHTPKKVTFTKKDCWLFFAAGVFHIFLPFIGEFWALQFLTSAKTAIVYSLTPFIAAVLSYFILKKSLTKKQLIGLLIGLCGLMPIFISGNDLGHLFQEMFYVSLPEVVLLFAVVSASYAWFIVSDLMSRGYSISLINGISMAIGGVLSLILWWVVAGDVNPIKGDMNSFLLWTGLLVLVANVISYNFYGWLLKHISINAMSALGFFCPIFASFYGWYFLNERLGWSHMIALVMVIFALGLFYQDEVRKLKKTNKTSA